MAVSLQVLRLKISCKARELSGNLPLHIVRIRIELRRDAFELCLSALVPSYTTSGLPSKLWGEAILTVTYLKNRSPTKALASHGTLYEAWYHHKPDLSHLWPFSYVAYHCNEDPHQKKIGEKSWRSVKFQLLGHEGTSQ